MVRPEGRAGTERSSLRTFVLLAGAIVLFGAATMLVILHGSPGTPGSPGSDPVLPAGEATALPPPVPRNYPPTAPLPPPPRVEYGPAPVQAPAGSWEAVTPVPRLSNLGPVGAAVGRELIDLQPSLSACFDEVSQARHGQRRPTTTQDEGQPAETGTTVLMLELEVSPGEVRIADAPVESRGGASDGLVSCAQGVLRGRTFKVTEARGNTRARVTFPLVQ